MFDRITRALQQRKDVRAWSLSQVTTRDEQLYAAPAGIEARRTVFDERYEVNVMTCSTDETQGQTCGSGNITIIEGSDIEQAVDLAVQMARKVHNPPYDFPKPAETPDVALVDEAIATEPEECLTRVFAEMQTAAAGFPAVRMTAAECYAKLVTTHFTNSYGIDSTQTATRVDAEFVLHCRKGERETEAFYELSRRRIDDLEIAAHVREHARMALDLQDAAAPEAYSGPVVLRDDVLATFLNGGMIQLLSSAEAKFRQITPWETGKSIFRREGSGDPLTMWANRQMPFGLHADRFDEEGLPAERLLLIEKNNLVNRWAKKRYADYLSLPATGSFGDIEVQPGATPAQDLRIGLYAEIAKFSWFNPDPITGDFASEIRAGYWVDGEQRTPFKGGMLVGNVLDALANARWSAETGFYGSYLGPTTARFEGLKITGG